MLDNGINLIDTSVDYGRSEERVGRCPIDAPPNPARPSPHDYRPANVRADVEQSLRRLRTDRLDIVQIHMSPSKARLETDHTIETLESLRDEGKVRFLGMSGILPDLPDHIAMGVFDVFQIPYSVVQREHEELITTAAASGAGTLIRGGTARGGPSNDKGWRQGPLTQAAGVGKRRWEGGCRPNCTRQPSSALRTAAEPPGSVSTFSPPGTGTHPKRYNRRQSLPTRSTWWSSCRTGWLS